MAYVNVKDWSVDQVIDWLKGLDGSVLQYTTSFLNNCVSGPLLLILRADDLEHLGVNILGHQEIILEAVEHLRHFHFELDKENLQTLALKLTCTSNSLYRQLLSLQIDSKLETQILSDVHNIITQIKPLVCWLDRSPFAGDKDYTDIKTQLLQHAFEMAISAHRDIFSEQPVGTIRTICEKLTKLADKIIQEIKDPLILQPASLDLATLKKKEQELGFYIFPSNHSIHQIAEIKYGSPAHSSSKIEEGDEIVQVNYLTVVGWQRKNVMFLLQESPPEIVLTLKKRPKHTKVYGQIYMKPYRLPSKKRGQHYSRWNENLPSPVLLPIPDLLPIKIRPPPVIELEPVDLESEVSESDSEPPDSPFEHDGSRMYPLKPRPILQRRNTITGAITTNCRPYPTFEQCRELLRNAASRHLSSNHIDNANFDEDTKCLRDKSASYSLGLELNNLRPTTVIGITQNRNDIPSFHNKTKVGSIKKHVNFLEKNDPDDVQLLKPPETNLDEEKSLSTNSLSSLNNENISFIDEGRDLTDRTSMTSGWQKEIVEELIETIKMKPRDSDIKPPPPPLPSPVSTLLNSPNPILKDTVLAEVNIHNIIKKFDEQSHAETKIKPKVMPRTHIKKPPEVPAKIDQIKKPVVPPRSVTTVITTKVRGKLDKSHSTPAYDLTEESGSKEILTVEMNEKVTEMVLVDDPKVQSTVKKEVQTTVETITTESIDIVVQKSSEADENKSDTTNEQIDLTKSEIITIPLVPDLSNYQLGIPVVQTVNVLQTHINELPVQSEVAVKLKVVHLQLADSADVLPPKPPPRNFLSNDLNRPAYPSDSPKPLNLVELSKSNQNTPKTPTRIFEFPDPHSRAMHSSQSDISLKSTNLESNYVRTPYAEKGFEPKVVSTPVNKTKHDTTFGDSSGDSQNYKSSSSFDLHKAESKVSPTNSIVRAMIYSNKNKGIKRKNLTAKRRRVTVNELNPADMQGWLFQRLRVKQTQNVNWEKRWFVLVGSNLYGFKTKTDSSAACLIFLPGFTVAVASEVKSRSNAFKVYHTGTVFYFSTEDAESLQQWIDLIMAATLLTDSSKSIDGSLFSETEDSDNEKSKSLNEKTDSLRKFGSLKKFTGKKSSDGSHSGITSLDRKWFFNKSSSSSKNALPVPTAQFRSYRRIKASDPPPIGSVVTGNFTSHVNIFTSSLDSQQMNVSVPNLTAEPDNLNSLPKNKPLNFIHASNPSLCNTNEFIVLGKSANSTTASKKSYKHSNSDNLAGFVTLEELMIKQSEERRMNPHSVFDDIPINFSLIKPDVVYGEVPIRPKEKLEMEEKSHVAKKNNEKTSRRSSFENIVEKNEPSSSCFGRRLGSLKKHNKDSEFENKTSTYPKIVKGCDRKSNNSLPRMHKMQEKNTKEKHGKQYSSDRNLYDQYEHQSYEMIYPETISENVQFAQNRNLDDRMYNVESSSKKSYKIKKQHSFTSSDKKFKSDYLMKSSKIADSSSGKVKLKSTSQYTPISLPLSQDQKQKPKFAFELNLDEKAGKSGKLKQIFGKQSETKKEKTFLGSPKLHRAIFKKNSSNVDSMWVLNSQPVHLEETSYSLDDYHAAVSVSDNMAVNIAPHTDYPGLEYPPVFEPETYSLADPESSLSVLRKQNKNN